MLDAIMAQIVTIESAQHNAIIAEQVGGRDLPALGPAGGAEGAHILRLARAPDGHEDGKCDGEDGA